MFFNKRAVSMEVPVVDFTAKYIGEISSVPGGDGYGFINIKTVTKEDGSAHNLPTTENIFVHQDECASPIRVGMKVEFSIAEDSKRGAGYYRATGAIEFAETELLLANGPVIPGLAVPAVNRAMETAVGFVRQRIPFHANVKQVSKETVDKVVENAPMANIQPGGEPTPEQQRELLAAFLLMAFPMMSHFGANFDALNADDAALDELVRQSMEDMQALGMNEQVPVLEKQAKDFKNVRDALRMIFEEGLVRTDTIIPIRNLPDLFMAVPVWYYWVESDGQNAIDQQWNTKDPYPHVVTKWFCDRFPNPNWVDTFLMFNRRLRTLKMFKGDVIPPHVSRRMRKAVKLFDYVVIMTPYHDVAGKDWQNLNWIRMIDPYVIGFKKGVPYFFVLGRFSDTGLFPLLHEMVGDTIEFLKTNKQKLEGFNAANSPFWLAPGFGLEYCYTDNNLRLGDYLIRNTDLLIQAFADGHLFDWLRGENPPAGELAKR